jgi:hypothetical protein
MMTELPAATMTKTQMKHHLKGSQCHLSAKDNQPLIESQAAANKTRGQAKSPSETRHQDTARAAT